MHDLTFTNLGATKSATDYRDNIDPALALVAAPPATYQTDYFPPVEDFAQGKLGICTSSLISIMEYLNFKKTGVYTKLSRRFLYAVGKNLIDGNMIEGSSVRTMLKVARNYGACSDALYPSAVGNMTHAEYLDLSKVPATAWQEAKQFRIGGYLTVGTDVDSIKAAIFKYGLVYSMLYVGEEWFTSKDGLTTWDKAFINPLRPPQTVISGHAVVYYGYDKNHVKVLNDWGLPWCDQDTALLPPNYPTIEAWAVTTDNVPNDLPSADMFHHKFLTPMKRGDRGGEVRNLQIALMISGDMDFVMPDDRSYYGALTQAAVLRYQIRRGIPLSYLERYFYAGRYVGPKTMAVLNKDYV